jgi:hypothetical protein
VADVLATDHEDDHLGDVRRVVRDPLEVLDDEEELDGAVGGAAGFSASAMSLRQYCQ